MSATARDGVPSTSARVNLAIRLTPTAKKRLRDQAAAERASLSEWTRLLLSEASQDTALIARVRTRLKAGTD